MTMHLEGPWLTTTGKIKSKRRKYASADAARKERELKAEWQQRQREWNQLAPQFGSSKISMTATATVRISPQYPPGREPQQHIPSLDTGVTGAVTVKTTPKYTGTKVKGIGTMHKSNAVPIFSDDDAVDIARMRR
jgi:hypothetical protein